MDENELFQPMLLQLPPQANLQLPDPDLLGYYKDINRRIYWLTGEICDDNIDLIKYIIRCNIDDAGTPIEQRQPIIIMINSNGGSVEVMGSIIGAIKTSKTPIATVNICNSYSAAAMILANGTKGMRYAIKGTNTMFHTGFTSISGTNIQVDNAKKYYDAVDKRQFEELFENSNFDAKTKKRIKTEDVYLNEEDCLKNGVIDKIIESFDELFGGQQ